jgi:hypothetical protein
VPTAQEAPKGISGDEAVAHASFVETTTPDGSRMARAIPRRASEATFGVALVLMSPSSA